MYSLLGMTYKGGIEETVSHYKMKKCMNDKEIQLEEEADKKIMNEIMKETERI